MKTQYFVLYSFICVFLFHACIPEHKVIPATPNVYTSNPSYVTSTSGGNNGSNNLINYINSISYGVSEPVDSNKNQYLSSFKIRFTFSTKQGSKIKYSIYASPTFSSQGSMALLYESPLIDNYQNKAISFSKKFSSDSILSLSMFNSYLSNTDKSNLNLFLVVQDSANNYYEEGGYSGSLNYSNAPIYFRINSSFGQIERRVLDLQYAVNYFYDVSIYNPLDSNKNGAVQPPRQFKFNLYTSSPNNSAYLKVYFSKNYGTDFLLYGTTSSVNIPSNANSTSIFELTNPSYMLTTGGYYFKVDAYDSKTNIFLTSSNTYSRLNVEVPSDDKRTFTLAFVDFINIEDRDGDTYPSAYKLKFKIKSSDNQLPTSSTLNIRIADAGELYYNTMLTKYNVNFADTVNFIISSNTNYSRGFYDFAISLEEEGLKFCEFNGATIQKLAGLKFEKSTED